MRGGRGEGEPVTDGTERHDGADGWAMAQGMLIAVLMHRGGSLDVAFEDLDPERFAAGPALPEVAMGPVLGPGKSAMLRLSAPVPRARTGDQPGAVERFGALDGAEKSHLLLLAALNALGGSTDLPADAFTVDALGTTDGVLHEVRVYEYIDPDGTTGVRLSVAPNPQGAR